VINTPDKLIVWLFFNSRITVLIASPYFQKIRIVSFFVILRKNEFEVLPQPPHLYV